ncbi:MAG: TolC family protein [Acidobacteria bacterium]|nr:TolC family protein [Acidobacteriota bacterium]
MRLWVLLVVVFPALAQTRISLTLDEAVAMALRQNPAVVTAQRAIEGAEARIKQARSDYFPQLGFNGIAKMGLSGGTNQLGMIGLPNSPFYRNFADSLNASYLAYDFGRTKHGVRVERRRREAAEADLAATEALVILGTERAFYGLLRARRLLEVAAEIVRSRETTVRQAQAFYEGKIRSRLDLDLARVGLSEAQLDLIEAENAVRTAIVDLGRALGASQEADYHLQAPDLTPAQPDPMSKLIQEAYQLRPDLQSLQAEREAVAESVQLARSRRKPFLSFVFSGGYARFTNVLARQLLAGGAGLLLPVFTGFQLEGEIEESEARLRLLESSIEELMQQIALETRTAYVQLQNGLQSLPALKLRAEYAREAVHLAGARYRERLGTIVELNQAEVGQAQAEAGEVTGTYRVKSAEAELRFAVGRR